MYVWVCSNVQTLINEDDEEEKEVDPSLVGTLDNVYTEAPGTMPGEDPFKRVPMMQDNEKPSNLMEMEKNLDAMEASIESESLQELDSSDDMSSLDISGRTRQPLAEEATACALVERVREAEGGGEHRQLNQQPQRMEGEERGVVGGASIMPDLLTNRPASQPDIQLSSQPAPDVTDHSRNPGLAGGSRSLRSPQGAGNGREPAIDLLHNTTSTAPSLPTSSGAVSTDTQPLDLTDGLLGLRVGPRDGGREET